MDAIIPLIAGATVLVVLVQILFARSPRDRDRHIRNTDTDQLGAC